MKHIKGTKWTREDVIDGVLYVKEKLGVDCLPSHSQMNKFEQGNMLRKAIHQYWTTKELADYLGIPEKESESNFGETYERYAIEHITSKLGYSAKKTVARHPYDILADGNVKIDVKVSHLSKNNCNAYANVFNLEKKEPTCDIFVCYCLGDNKRPDKVLVIPSSATTGICQLGVGENSKWDKYKDNWKLVKKYADFHKTVI